MRIAFRQCEYEKFRQKIKYKKFQTSIQIENEYENLERYFV